METSSRLIVKPKFKVGDIVTNISGLCPNVKCTISEVNYDKQCYYYKEVGGITNFKEQNLLKLVGVTAKLKADDEVRLPVEGDNKLDILEKSYASDAQYNTFKYNLKHYKLIENISKQIIAMSEAGAISYHLVVPMKKEADEGGVYYVEDEVCGIIRWHFDKLGYKIKETIKENEYNEFFITW
jgi:hypothetical protein